MKQGYADTATLCDINLAAVEVAKENIDRNHLANRAQAVVSDVFNGVAKDTYERIIFNLPFWL